MVYELPYLKVRNLLRKNGLGYRTFSPVYTYETGEWVTVQSQQDANLNGDPAGDRVITNQEGQRCFTVDRPLWAECRQDRGRFGQRSYGTLHPNRSGRFAQHGAKYTADARYQQP